MHSECSQDGFVSWVILEVRLGELGERVLPPVEPEELHHKAVIDGIVFRSMPAAVLCGERVVSPRLVAYTELGDSVHEARRGSSKVHVDSEIPNVAGHIRDSEDVGVVEAVKEDGLDQYVL